MKLFVALGVTYWLIASTLTVMFYDPEDWADYFLGLFHITVNVVLIAAGLWAFGTMWVWATT